MCGGRRGAAKGSVGAGGWVTTAACHYDTCCGVAASTQRHASCTTSAHHWAPGQRVEWVMASTHNVTIHVIGSQRRRNASCCRGDHIGASSGSQCQYTTRIVGLQRQRNCVVLLRCAPCWRIEWVTASTHIMGSQLELAACMHTRGRHCL